MQYHRLARLRAAREALSRQPASPRRDALLQEIRRRIVATETGEIDRRGWSRSPWRRDDHERPQALPDQRHQLSAAFGLYAQPGASRVED